MDAIFNLKTNINLKDTKPWIESKNFSGKKSNFHYPKTLKEAYNISINKKNTYYLSGGTDLNLNEEVSHNKTNYILLNRILELNSLEEKDNEIHIGAALTLEDTLPHFEKYFSPLAEILRRFGSSQIRSQATIAGNLCTASPIGDTAPSLMALGGTVTIFSNNKIRYIAMDDLFADYRKTVLNPNDILCSIILPIPSREKSYYAWKVSKRHDQDISTVSIAALIGVNENNIIQSCKICFGGLSATTLRTKEVENTLLGNNPISAQNNAINKLKKTIKPLSDLRGSANYRIDLAVGLLKRLLYCVSNKNFDIEVMKVNINE
jgi:xanthine dehydrogenase small subunit